MFKPETIEALSGAARVLVGLAALVAGLLVAWATMWYRRKGAELDERKSDHQASLAAAERKQVEELITRTVRRERKTRRGDN